MDWSKGFFANIMTSGLYNSVEFQHRNQVIFMNTVIMMAISFVSFFAVSDLILGNKILSIILFSVVGLMLTLFFVARVRKCQQFVRYPVVIIAQSTFLYLVISGGMDSSGIFWSYSIPLITFFILNKKGGIILSSFYGIMMALLLVWAPLGMPHHSTVYIIRSMAAYIVVSLFSFLFEMVLVTTQENLLNINQRFEKTNKKLTKTLRELTSTRESMIEMEKFAVIGKLVAGVAHEINTPLGNSVTASSLAQGRVEEMAREMESGVLTKSRFDNLMEQIRKAQSSLEKNLERAASLIVNFKQLSVDQMQEEKRVFNLKQYLESVLTALYPSLKKTAIEIKLELAENLEINSLPGLWSQIITNLIQNSLIHGYEPDDTGVITLNFKKEKNNLKFVYSNDGKGIPATMLNHIFEPFYSTSKHKGGTGLGLSILYNIVTANLGGTVKCESPGEKGVVFTIVVPL